MLIMAAAVTVQQAAIQPLKGLSLSVSPEIASHFPGGVEVIRAVVSPDGAISTCDASVVGRGPVTDKENCRKLMRFTATPALDQDGHRAYGTAEFRIVWNVFRSGDRSRPPAVLRPAEPELYLPLSRLPDGVTSEATSTLILVAGNDGKVETCQIQQSSGAAALDNAACRALALAGVTPLKDETGVSVRAIHTVRVGFSVKP